MPIGVYLILAIVVPYDQQIPVIIASKIPMNSGTLGMGFLGASVLRSNIAAQKDGIAQGDPQCTCVREPHCQNPRRERRNGADRPSGCFSGS